MNAAIDIGNSSVKIGFFSEENLIEVITCKLQNISETMSDKDLDGVIISSVQKTSDQILEKIREKCKQLLFLDAQTTLPFALNYDTPQTLGVDRLAAIAGALLHSDKNTLVIDLGTCVTYDLITKDKVFQGGIISPGYSMRLKAMNKFTAGLPIVEPNENPDFIGKSTESCMQSGAFHGLLAEINQLIKYYSQQIEDLAVIICGGDSYYFEKKIELDTFVLPNLVLEGLNSILRINAVEK